MCVACIKVHVLGSLLSREHLEGTGGTDGIGSFICGHVTNVRASYFGIDDIVVIVIQFVVTFEVRLVVVRRQAIILRAPNVVSNDSASFLDILVIKS